MAMFLKVEFGVESWQFYELFHAYDNIWYLYVRYKG